MNTRAILVIIAVVVVVGAAMNVKGIKDVMDNLIDTRLVIIGWPENPVSGHVTWNIHIYYQTMNMSGTDCLVGDVNTGDMITWSCDKVDQDGWGGAGSAPLNYYTTHYLVPCWINDPAGDYVLKIDARMAGYEPQHLEKRFSLKTYAYEGKLNILNFPSVIHVADHYTTAYLEFDCYYQSLGMSGTQSVPGSQILVQKERPVRADYGAWTFSSGHVRIALSDYMLFGGEVYTITLTGGADWQYGLVTETRTVTVAIP